MVNFTIFELAKTIGLQQGQGWERGEWGRKRREEKERVGREGLGTGCRGTARPCIRDSECCSKNCGSLVCW